MNQILLIFYRILNVRLIRIDTVNIYSHQTLNYIIDIQDFIYVIECQIQWYPIRQRVIFVDDIDYP